MYYMNMTIDVITTLDTAETAVERLPFFVYGTLRQGQGNFRWSLEGRTSNITSARLHEHTMYSNGGFPYAVPGAEGDVVVGEVMYVHDHFYEQVLDALDTLEGFTETGDPKNLYERERHFVTLEDGTQEQVWAYIMAPNLSYHSMARLVHVPSGDWMLAPKQ